jgi:hypothetical protein
MLKFLSVASSLEATGLPTGHALYKYPTVSDDPVDLNAYVCPAWSVMSNHFAVVVELSVYGPALTHVPGVVGAGRVLAVEHGPAAARNVPPSPRNM